MRKTISSKGMSVFAYLFQQRHSHTCRERPTLWCKALSRCGGGAQAGCELEFLEAVVVVCLRTQDGHAVLRDAGVSEGNIIPADG